MSEPTPHNVHVLFVHGVGRHSRLASLMQAFQSMRVDTRSPEAPHRGENAYPDWQIDEFVDDSGSGATPRLKLTSEVAQRTVYLYEVNYSTLAGVLRANQPLDLTALFVGFDLAVNVARTRLAAEPAASPPVDARLDIDHLALAQTAQKIAGVLVAATMPVLGLPALVFRGFTENVVAVFTRFFEDIATFALDMNGEELIAAHFRHTVRNIVDAPLFVKVDAQGRRDRLIIAAHSLGTVVAHRHVLQHRASRHPTYLPDGMLSFGSPIGLVCWLWLLLDFHAMDFSRKRNGDDSHDGDDRSDYFVWTQSSAADVPPEAGALQWINVVNHLDPIATAFPAEYIAMSQSPQQSEQWLAGGRIHQRFIDTRSWPGVAHTKYFDDRDGLLEILGRMAGMRVAAPENVADPATGGRSGERHWRAAIERLTFWRRLTWVAGVGFIAVYLGALAWLCRSWVPLLLLPLYAFAPATIGTLAFFQRLFFSRPTKRTSGAAIQKLRWCDLRSKPHRMRHHWRRLRPEDESKFVSAEAPCWGKKMLMWGVSFAPSLLAMVLPIALAPRLAECWPFTARFPEYGEGVRDALLEHPVWLSGGALALFTLYLIAFTLSEFSAHWRQVIRQATRRPGDRAADPT